MLAAMILSTAISDAVLAVAAFAFVVPLAAAGRELRAAALGFALMGAAALCGSLKFAGVVQLEWLHRALSDLATAVSMPTIGAGALALVLSLAITPRGWRRWIGGLVALCVAARYAGVMASYGLVIGALGTFAVVAAGMIARGRAPIGSKLLLVGAALVLVAGLAVGTVGEIGPFARIDVFHYLLAVADRALAGGLLRVADAR